MRKSFYIFSLLSLILFFCAFLFSCENDRQEIKEVTGPKKVLPAMEAKDVFVDYRDSGFVVLKMRATHLKQFENNVAEPYYEADHGVKIWFYDKLGKEVSRLSAEYGIYYVNSQRVEVKYKVIVENKEGKRLETERLMWRQNDSIRADGQVVMFENNRKIIGKKLSASEDFSHMELSDIIMSLPIEEDKEKIKK